MSFAWWVVAVVAVVLIIMAVASLVRILAHLKDDDL